MDPMQILSAISIATTIVKGITTIHTASGWTYRKIVGEEILEKRKLNETALEPVLKKAIEEVAETIEPMGEAKIHQISLFLTSPEAEAIVRQIYSASILSSREKDLDEIEKEFLTAFSLYTNIPEDELEDSAPAIFKILLTGCDEVLRSEIDRGRLSAHEAKSNFRYRILLDELQAMRKNVEFLIGLRRADVQEILKFEQVYRQQVSNRHKSITPPDIEVAKQFPIDDLYVEPDFARIPRGREERLQKLTIDEFSQSAYRAVVLGDPGIGKSTLTEKLCYDLAKQDPERLWLGRQVTPILVVLRLYAGKKKERDCSIREFMETTAKSKYQKESPPGAFEYLLLNGRSVVIFDGLDELTDTSDRREITGDVESFCNLYPSVPVLVTSRKVGYKKAPLDEELFETFHLADFNDDQVKEYVEKRFALDRDLSPEERQQKIDAFLDESRTVRDLRSNALMLGLMCNLYKAAGYIPKSRYYIYEKCTEMLFDRWDKSKGIALPEAIKNIESWIEAAIMYLAHWIYTNKKLQEGVKERKLVAKTIEYLVPRRIEDPDDAELAANEFVRFCRGRAWVFTDMGTTENGTNLYQFVHNTFMEYFTATHLVRTSRSPEQLAEVLLPRIAKQEWDVVAQLAIQKKNRDTDEAADELLAILLEKARQVGGEEGWNLLHFAARCLRFIVPSPKVTREIVTACVDLCLAIELKEINENDEFYENYELIYSGGTIYSFSESEEIIFILCEAAHENKKNIKYAAKRHFEAKINASQDEGLVALELLICFGLIDNSWEDIYKDIFDSYSSQIDILCTNYVKICVYTYYLNIIPISNLIKWHGFEALFIEVQWSVFDQFIPNFVEYILYLIVELIDWSFYLEGENNILLELEEIGNLSLCFNFPFLMRIQYVSYLQGMLEARVNRNNDNIEEMFKSNWEAIFGAFILFAIILEATDTGKALDEAVKCIAESKIAFFDFIRWTFVARFAPEAMDKAQAELDDCGFNSEQQAFVWRWVRGEMNLVKLPPEQPGVIVD
ncbi:MAG: NACHT domain-containing protein [Oscillatoria sp. SIO1A7]|nr:NACHT domain-containing protein [Oscillatoria sp. SIO1A7]